MHLMEASSIISMCTSRVQFLLYLGKCFKFVVTSNLGRRPSSSVQVSHI